MLNPSPARGRFARLAALVAVAGAGAATLAACTKPLPEVTFQSGPSSVLVAPSTYCFDLTKSSCHDGGTVSTLNAAPGGSINISVPRSVALNAWIASAQYTDNTGKSQTLDVGSNLVTDNHHARVPVPNLGVSAYLLVVTEFRGTTPTGAWTVQVNVTN